MAQGKLTAADAAARGVADAVLRRPVEADHAAVVGVIDEWWGGRRMRAALPRLWFRHFTGTSLIAESPDGRLRGVLIAFVSPDAPENGVIQLIGVDPNLRRRGLGRRLLERVAGELAGRGVRRLSAVVPADDRPALDFFRALGFGPDDGPGTVKLWGTPAIEDYDGPGADRAVLTREVAP